MNKWTPKSILSVIRMVVVKSPDNELGWRILKAIEIIKKELEEGEKNV